MEGIPNPRIRKILECIHKDPKRLRHMLFYGPPGSGKTSTARHFIESWYPKRICPPGATLFLNASDERGLESIRERVFPFLNSKALLAEHTDLPRFLVFDEAETLTVSAQLALRSILDEHPLEKCCILFLVNTISGVKKSLYHRFLRIRFDPLPSECLGERVKLYAPDKETPTPLDAVRLRGDLRIFLHAPNASQELARKVWNWIHNPEYFKTEKITRRLLEDLYWVGAVFGVLDLDIVKRIVSLCQTGVLRTMPFDLYKHKVNEIREAILRKIDNRIVTT